MRKNNEAKKKIQKVSKNRNKTEKKKVKKQTIGKKKK
mgnify:CR=1 FL=1